MRKSALQVFAALLAVASSAVAQLYDVQISAVPRKLDEQKDRQESNHVTVTTKEIAYDSNGTIIGEYSNPTTISKKREWKE